MLSSLTRVLDRHLIPESTGSMDQKYMVIDTLSLRTALEKVPAPRAKRGVRYPFPGLLLLLVCAVFSGAKTLTMIVEWAQHAHGSGALFPCGKVPSVATIHRLAARIDPVALDDAVNTWVRVQARERGRCPVIAVDGKAARGAKNGGATRVFPMAALDHATGSVTGQESIGEKTNEIPHFATLMDRLGDLSGAVITADALHTQREHAEDLHKRGAHYVFTVKANQPALRARISSQTWSTRGVQYVCGKRAMGAPPSGPPQPRQRKTGSISPMHSKQFV